jgi:hypothetical protein
VPKLSASSAQGTAAAGLLFATWAGLVIMLVGAVATPASWCSAGGQSPPEGHTVMAAGVSVVAITGALAILLAHFTKSRQLWIGLGVTAAALVGVLVYASVVGAGWGSACP